MKNLKKFRIKSFKEQETLVELNKVSMFYNKRQILNDLNLKINRNEVLGMLGPNGVGKSTIFHIITGLKDPSYGKVLINNSKPFALIKIKEKEFEFDKELNCENAKVLFKKPQWLSII